MQSRARRHCHRGGSRQCNVMRAFGRRAGGYSLRKRRRRSWLRRVPEQIAPSAFGSRETRRLLARFWHSASGYWRGPGARGARALAILLIVNLVLQLLVQYRLNFWNRDFFNAVERRDQQELVAQALILVPLALASLLVTLVSIWARMTTQRSWRAWLSRHLYAIWLGQGRVGRLHTVRGDHSTPEYRIADDARIATDVPIDLILGLISAVLSAATFIGVLWTVGDELTFNLFGHDIVVHGYLVIAVVTYSVAVTAATMFVGRRLMEVTTRHKQTEAELREVGARLREQGATVRASPSTEDNMREIETALDGVIAQWQALCWQCIRMALIGHSNVLLTPFISLVLCMPKYVAGTMTLGELVQAAAAFVIVQSAFNWITDSYARLAEWVSSANRVGSLLVALDQIGHRPAKHDAHDPAPCICAPAVSARPGQLATG